MAAQPMGGTVSRESQVFDAQSPAQPETEHATPTATLGSPQSSFSCFPMCKQGGTWQKHSTAGGPKAVLHGVRSSTF